MKIKDLTTDHCIVSSTPEEWATVQNIFLMNGYKIHVMETFTDTFEGYPLTCLYLRTEDKAIVNVNEYCREILGGYIDVPAAEFIVANVPNVPEETPATDKVVLSPMPLSTYVEKTKQLIEQINERHKCRTPYKADGRTPVIENITLGTDLEQLQDEIEMAVRKDITENSHLFDMPFQIANALAAISFNHLRTLLASRFPLMNSVPADETDNKNEPSAHSANVM